MKHLVLISLCIAVLAITFLGSCKKDELKNASSEIVQPSMMNPNKAPEVLGQLHNQYLAAIVGGSLWASFAP